MAEKMHISLYITFFREKYRNSEILNILIGLITIIMIHLKYIYKN